MEPASQLAAEEGVAAVFRSEFGRAVALVARSLGDIGAAEDAVAEAYATALRRWPRDGIPDNPAGWIVTVARNQAIDQLRRQKAMDARQQELIRDAEQRLEQETDVSDDGAIPDERLQLIFTCCHPALAPEAQAALTLRMVGGLTVPEIARALLTREDAVAQRLVRAKRKLRVAVVPLRVPDPEELPDRLAIVLAVVYLVFTEGYAATVGPDLRRDDVAEEAVRLGRVLADLMPREGEVIGLLALMLLHHARRAARTDDHGDVVLLENQDRSRWDAAAIEEGRRLTERALRLERPPGPYAIQAAIAALHDTAAGPDDTDWLQIAGLYGALARQTGSPVVELNRAVAVAMADGPAAGLAILETLDDPALANGHLLPATRAGLLRRIGRMDDARSAYREALGRVTNDAERSHLARRLAELE